MRHTIAQSRTLHRCAIGQRWEHNAGYYHFHRSTPTDQRHIPFATTRRERLRRQWPQIRDAILGTVLLALFIALLVSAPVWARWLP